MTAPARATTAADGRVMLSGWGRTAATAARLATPATTAEVQASVRASWGDQRGVAPRGLGRSYGDPAQNAGGTVVDMTGMDEFWLDRDNGTLTAAAGASFDALLRHAVPRGYFVPVTPGTRFVTVGGAVAADIHGKNHHRDGSLGKHTTELELVSGDSQVRIIRPDREDTREQFWATVGGMGQTGIITRATMRMLPISSSRIRVDTRRFESLDSLMSHMAATDADYRYTVAWVDSVTGRGDFRSVLTCGDHAERESLPAKLRSGSAALHYNPRVRLTAPARMPNRLLNRATVAAFNTAWFRKAAVERTAELQSIAEFFHPLDMLRGWNRIYGRAGFLQYQFVVPDSAAELVGLALAELRSAGAPSFLTVLKRFGPANPAPLSFPRPGWTLAIDLPAGVPGLDSVLDLLDSRVAEAGGRLYLAKDSRMSAAMFRQSYPRLDEWLTVKNQMDPRGLFTSDQFRRLLG